MILPNLILPSLIPYEYKGVKTFEAMDAPASVRKLKNVPPLSHADRDKSRLTVMRERGTIRVGYFANNLPLVFRNGEDKLVGFDMEKLAELANDLDLKLGMVFIKERQNSTEMLSDGRWIFLLAVISYPLRALDITFSAPYTHYTAAFIAFFCSCNLSRE